MNELIVVQEEDRMNAWVIYVEDTPKDVCAHGESILITIIATCHTTGLHGTRKVFSEALKEMKTQWLILRKIVPT